MNHRSNSGFTLVELAIVLMIIGLLIGGILKGQELIQNARITSTIRQFSSYDAAILTFMDSYGAKPGDIVNPSLRLPNCSAAPCNIAGDGNGIIGSCGAANNNENPALWQHLAAAGLVSGIDTSRTWSSAGVYSTTAYFPTTPVGNIDYIMCMTIPSGPTYGYPNGISGHLHYLTIQEANTSSASVGIVQRIDTKIDDGHPFMGQVMVAIPACPVASGSNNYPVSSFSNPCDYYVLSSF